MIWGDEAEVRSFEDRWAGAIKHYVGWMKDRVVEMHRVLKRTGSLYLHCDPHASHHLKVMVDEVFGAANFRNEISSETDLRPQQRQALRTRTRRDPVLRTWLAGDMECTSHGLRRSLPRPLLQVR